MAAEKLKVVNTVWIFTSNFRKISEWPSGIERAWNKKTSLTAGSNAAFSLTDLQIGSLGFEIRDIFPFARNNRDWVATLAVR